MARVAVAHSHAGGRPEQLAVLHRPELPCRVPRLVARVQGVLGATTGPLRLALRPLGLHLLDVGRIEQHDLGKVGGGGGGVDGSIEAFGHQTGKQPGVVDVGVGQQDESDCPRVEREGLEVAGLVAIVTLMHAAVHQELDPPDHQQVAGAGDLLRRTAELQLHAPSPRRSSSLGACRAD